MTVRARSRALAALALGVVLFAPGCSHAPARRAEPSFCVLAFFTGKQDQAHISFLGEAVKWFPAQATAHGFAFDTRRIGAG